LIDRLTDLGVAYKKMDEATFESLFRKHFMALVAFAMKFLRDTDTAKEIVHDVFIRLWEKRDNMDPQRSIKSYLFTSVHNRCLNYIRDNKKYDHSEFHLEKLEENTNWENNDKLVETETELRIRKAIDDLPDKCREIFILSRFEELKYAEIATKLGISIKTVEAQMSRALKSLRENLIEYITIVVLVMSQLFIF
jgi:RNA polymerase sigma-70 factor (ECF subfamily)